MQVFHPWQVGHRHAPNSRHSDIVSPLVQRETARGSHQNGLPERCCEVPCLWVDSKSLCSTEATQLPKGSAEKIVFAGPGFRMGLAPVRGKSHALSMTKLLSWGFSGYLGASVSGMPRFQLGEAQPIELVTER